MGATNVDWFALVKDGGAYCAPLLLAAIYWLQADRSRLLEKIDAQDEKLAALAERTITIATELRNFLFNERKAS